MDVTLPNGTVIRGVPETATREQIMQRAIAAGLATPEDFGIARAPETVAEAEIQAQQPEQQRGAFRRFAADPALEAMAAVNRGVTQTADFLTTSPANALLELAGSERRVPAITDLLAGGAAGGFMEDGIGRDIVRTGGELVAPGVATGQAFRSGAQALPQLGRAAESVRAGTLRQMGSSTAAQDAGFSAAAGAGAVLGREADQALGGSGDIGEFAGAVAAPLSILGAAHAVRDQGRRSADMAGRLAAGSTDRDLARYMLRPEDPQAARPFYRAVTQKILGSSSDDALTNAVQRGAPRVQADRQAREAIKQGFDEGVVAAVKGTTPANREQMRRMVNISERGKNNAIYAATNRPADIAGNSLAKRVNYVRRVNREAAQNLDRVARSLRGKRADLETPANRFTNNLDEMGVTFRDDGTLGFAGSDIEDIPGATRIIRQVYARVNRNIDKQDAYEMHRLKRFIDENVSYGKSAEGLSGRAESAVKNLRRSIDESLDSQFRPYDRVNQKYSDTIRAIDAFQDAAGTKVNLEGENVGKALGTVSRRLLSNTQSRVNLMDSMKQMDDVAARYGGKFDDDIISLALFADELDAVFGPSARTSLQGDVAKATATGIRTVSGNRSLTGLAIDAAEKGIERSRGINKENAYKAIKRLLAERGTN